MRITSIALLAASAALLAACSSAPVPREQMAVAKSAVERVNANPGIVSSAPVELQAARDKLARAERAMSNRDYVQARRLAEQASVPNPRPPPCAAKAPCAKCRTPSARWMTNSSAAASNSRPAISAPFLYSNPLSP